MHLILIYLSVIMLLSNVAGPEVQDLSEVCTQGRIHDVYLTFGIGISDNLVSMLTTQTNFNCILRFTVKANNYIMMVLEFPDLKPEEKVCVLQEASNNTVMVRGAAVITVRMIANNRKLENKTLHFSDFNEGKNCQYIGSEPAYRSLSFEKSSVQLASLGDFSTVKVTATSMRGLKDFECLEANETECIFAEQVYCLTKKFACDEHINCGVPEAYDEDASTCKGHSLSFLMKLSSLLMGILTMFLFGSICLTLMPKRKETFVYRPDENIGIFDSESEIANAEIDVQIFYSDHL